MTAVRPCGIRLAAATAALLGAILSHPAEARAREPERLSADLTDPTARAQAQLDVLEGMVHSGLVTEALQIATQLRAGGLKSTRLDLLQAEAMHAQGMSGQAADMLRRVVKKEPRNAPAWSVLGIVLSDLKDRDGAMVALERAHRLVPTDPKVLNNLGYLEMAKGQNRRAIELFEAAIVQDPSSPRTRNNLGFALARLERDTDALAAFRAAGSEADARYNMGVACELRGDIASALTNYQAAVVASSKHAPASSALARLLHTESR